MADFGMVCGMYVYYTSMCLNEGKCHVHVSLRKKQEGSAKFWLYKGYPELVEKGNLHSRDIKEIEDFIKSNINRITRRWKDDSKNLMIH